MFVGTCVLNYTWNWRSEPPGNRKAQETEIRKREKSSHLTSLGGGFKYFLFSPLLGEDSHFD